MFVILVGEGALGAFMLGDLILERSESLAELLVRKRLVGFALRHRLGFCSGEGLVDAVLAGAGSVGAGSAGQARQGQARQGQARQGQARQGQARQGQARQGQARQGQAP